MRPDTDFRFQAGRLRHRINLKQLVALSPPSYNAAGPALDWVNFATDIPAQIIIDGTTDIVRDGQTITVTKFVVTIRYFEGVRSDMGVQARHGNYIIQGLNNVDERDWMMELTCIAYAGNF